MADRSRLHISRLDAFSEWLKKDGWRMEEPKGLYEVLRARKEGRKNPLIVYKKKDAKEHLSVMDRDGGVVGAFLKGAKGLPKKSQTNADRIRAMSDEELAEFLNRKIACDCCSAKHCNGGERCEFNILQWLKSEAKE